MKTNRARLKQWQFARATEVDESLRERAFLSVYDTINGALVLPFTLRHLAILSHAQSPFIYGGVREIEDVGQFLWVVSPNYDTLPPGTSKRADFLAELVAHSQWDRFYRGIDRYLHRTFRDPPPQVKNGKKIGVCYAASILHAILHAYGGDDEKWMDKPIIRLFQYLKCIQAEGDPKTPPFNPSVDQVEAKFRD